jgi:hypothetical protein
VTPPPTQRLLLGAASPLTAEVVSGPARRALVLARFDSGLYLAVGAHHEVLPVVTSDALALPTSVRLPMRSHAVRWGVGPGDTVLVGASSLHLGPHQVRVVRRWRPSRVGPSAATVSGDRLGRLAEELSRASAGGAGTAGIAGAMGTAGTADPALTGRSADVVQAALSGSHHLVTALVEGMVGAGAGLTPSDDDALCGVLLVLRGAGAEEARALVDVAVGAADGRTTSLSASLLRSAAQGYALPAVADLVRAVLRDDRVALVPALAAVLAIGSSSGRDLVAGIAGAVRVLAARPARSSLRSMEVRQLTGRAHP